MRRTLRGDAPVGRFRRLLRLGGVARLCWRCWRDPRVGWGPKLLLPAAIAYVLLPADVLPDTIPLLGQLDDLAVLGLAASLFLAWCPRPVVEEHRSALGRRARGALAAT